MPKTTLGRTASAERTRGSNLNFNKLVPTMVLLAILLLGFELRLYRLGEQNIWWDEGHAVWAARQNLRQVTDITAHDVHPPLYLWMLHWWMRLVGESELAVRYLSLMGGILTISLTYVVARRLIGRRAALLATLLITTARFHIWWSQEARMYVWATFFSLLSLYFFTRLRQAQNITWWSFAASSAAALYTLYLSALVLILENLFVAVTVWRKPHRRRFLFHWVLSQLGILVLYVPWLYVALSFSRTDVARSSFPFSLVWQLYGTVLVTGISTNLDQYTWLVLAFALLALAGIVLFLFDRRQPQRYGFQGWEIGLLLFLPLVIPPLVVYGLSIPRGIFYSPKPEARYLLLFAPLFYILLAGTIAGFWQKRWKGQAVTILGAVLVLGTLVSVLPAHYVDRYLRDDYQTAMTTLAAYARPEDAVLLVSGDRYPIFLYYYNRRFPNADGPSVYLLPMHSARLTADNVQGELAPLSDKYERLWLASFERTLQDPDNVVEAWLDEHRTSVLHVSQDYNYLRLYADDNTRPTVDTSRSGAQHVLDHAPVLGASIIIYGYDLPTTEFRAGDVVRPGVYVQGRVPDRDAPGSGSCVLIFEWVDSSGQVIERQILPVPTALEESGAVRLMPAFAVYEYTPQGHYWIDVQVPEDQTASVRLSAGQVTQTRKLPARKAAVKNAASMGGESIRLLGYTVRPSAKAQAGTSMTVDLFWQAEKRPDRDYTVFVHVLGPYNPATGGPLWAQDDSYPLDGGHPTSRWLPGQTVPDRHSLDIPENAPSGPYQIEVGLYDASTGERLLVDQDNSDHILLNDIEVVTP